MFHAPVKQIMGYPGSAEQRLAIEQGALDGDCGSYSSIPLEWIDKQLAHSFVRFTRQRVDEIPESAVYIGTFATSDEQQQLLNLLNGGDEVGRPFIMSKEVPADHLAIIRKAFDDTMKDPAFLAEMAKQQLPVHPLDRRRGRENRQRAGRRAARDHRAGEAALRIAARPIAGAERL